MKKFILSLFAGFVGIISFCSATIYSVQSDTLNCTNGEVTYNLLGLPTFLTIKDLGDGGNYNLCFTCENNIVGSCSNQLLQGGQSFTKLSESLAVGCNGGGLSKVVVKCKSGGDDFSLFYSGTTAPCGGSCPECPTCPEVPECPEVNTGEILSGYILESEIDTNYCVGNGLCPNECGSGTDFSGDLQYSNIYINSILHPGRQNIFIDIPDYITRDYSSTGDDFNVYVGSGYDVDYINSIIDINSYRPTSTDFTDIFVGGLTLITPYIVVVLFFYLVWRLLKKIFS